MLDLTTSFSAPGSITTPYLRSFMQTFQVGIRNREANSSALHNMFVKAFDIESADEIARGLIAPYDMIVKDVIRPGSELYGEPEGADADPLPILVSEVMERLEEGEIPTPTKTAMKNIFGF
jgi:hypothetical protein